jgi:tRNA(adenine34) deaminase
MSSHEQFMRRCIELAREAEKSKDTLVGSLVILDGRIIGEGCETPNPHRSID